jgi:hypothetical protein
LHDLRRGEVPGAAPKGFNTQKPAFRRGSFRESLLIHTRFLSLPLGAAESGGVSKKIPQLRLFQNFSFWNSFLRFNRKTGLLTGFSKSLFKTNRVLEQAQLI